MDVLSFMDPFISKVDKHNSIFQNDSKKHDDTDKGIEGEGLSKDNQGQDCTKSGGRNRRHDSQGMDEIFIENSKNYVDCKDGDHKKKF